MPSHFSRKTHHQLKPPNMTTMELKPETLFTMVKGTFSLDHKKIQDILCLLKSNKKLKNDMKIAL
jgi:hypothetical protein